MRRKLFGYTLFFMGGVTGTYYWMAREDPYVMLFLMIGAAVLLFVLPQKERILFFLFLFFGSFSFFLVEYDFQNGDFFNVAGMSSEQICIHGTVSEIQMQDEKKYHIIVKTTEEKILVRYNRMLENPCELIGREIVFRSRPELPPCNGNPKTFDYRLYLRSEGIGYICDIETFQYTEAKVSAFYRLRKIILQKRECFFQRMHCREDVEGVLRGILFGDKSRMDASVYTAFRHNGTAHVLAVSGLHVGMLYSVYRALFQRYKKKSITFCFLVFLLLYGNACLWSVSVTRAIGLILMTMGARFFHRRYDLLTGLSAMALVYMAMNPYVIFGASFQMSFLAVTSIGFLEPVASRYLGTGMGPALSVQLGLLPYMAYVFNYVSLVGILCNIPIVFLLSIILPLAMTVFALFFFFSYLPPGTVEVLDGLTELMVSINQMFTLDGWGGFDICSPPLWMIIVIYGILFFCTSEYFYITAGRKDGRHLLPACLCIVCLVLGGVIAGYSPFDKAELVFVDVGQGDCLHMKTPGGKQVLVDGGGNRNYNLGEKTLKPYLLKNGISNVDFAAATHKHTDHYLGLEQLSACFPMGKILETGKAGDTIFLEDEYWLEILWPLERNPDTEDENRNSLIFMIHHNGKKTLVTGDITEEGECLLLQTYAQTKKLKADILKIAHHGSKYSTGDRFLNVVRPDVAVISVGKNHYGHPADNVIEKLRKRGIMIFRTDLDGAVGIINDKGKISICTEKQR